MKYVAVLALAATALGAFGSPAGAYHGGPDCHRVAQNDLSAGRLAPGETTGFNIQNARSISWLVLVAGSGPTSWRLSDYWTGKVWLSGETVPTNPAVVFTRPSTVDLLCVQVTNAGTAEIAYATHLRGAPGG